MLVVPQGPEQRTQEMMPLSNETLVLFILDQSGSMSSIKQATIDGFNKLLNDQRNVGEDMFVSLTLFSTSFDNRFTGVDITAVPELGTIGNPYAPSGGTALLDGVGQTIKSAETWIRSRGFTGKVLVVILTDGGENSSKSWHLKQPLVEGDALDVGGLIKYKTLVDNWEFVFLGSGTDWLERNFSPYALREGEFLRDRFYTMSHSVADSAVAYAGVSKGLTASRVAGQSFSTRTMNDEKDATSESSGTTS